MLSIIASFGFTVQCPYFFIRTYCETRRKNACQQLRELKSRRRGGGWCDRLRVLYASQNCVEYCTTEQSRAERCTTAQSSGSSTGGVVAIDKTVFRFTIPSSFYRVPPGFSDLFS